MGKGVIGIIFISLFILFGSVAFIMGQNGDNGDNGDEEPEGEGGGGGGGCTSQTCASLDISCGTPGDGCGGTLSCGTCTPGVTNCVGGSCVPIITDCVPNCAGKVCGGDGCDGSCGTCTISGESCDGGSCVAGPETIITCDNGYIVSSGDTLIGDSRSIPSVQIDAWTADIPEAIWIWSEATVSNPEVYTVVEFTRTFDISGIGETLDGSLVVAADNSYICTLNGVFVGGDARENNFADSEKDTYSLSGMLVEGENTLVCIVTNLAQAGGTSTSNPAGLLYRLDVDEGVCETPEATCTDTDDGVNYFVPGTASAGVDSSTDSCDGSTLTEYSCTTGGAITSSEFDCVCTTDDDGGYCELSGGGMACEAFSSHSVVDGEFTLRTDLDTLEGVIDEDLKALLESEDISPLTLSETPVKSKVANGGDVYYCGLDLLWHRVKPTVQNIECINEPNIECLSNDACDDVVTCDSGYSCEILTNKDGSPVLDDDDDPVTFCNYNTACLADYECESNSCVDNYCISISAELVAQRGILTTIWCVVTNLLSFTSDTQTEYLQCMYEAFGGV